MRSEWAKRGPPCSRKTKDSKYFFFTKQLSLSKKQYDPNIGNAVFFFYR